MHSLLRRQLRRVGIDAERGVPSAEQWRALLDRVDRTYTLADQDRYTLERSLELSSQEMRELYDDLRRRTESDLTRMVAVLDATLEAGIDGVLVVGADRRVLTYNRRFVEIWGLTSDVLESGSDVTLLDRIRPLLVDPVAFTRRVADLYQNTEATGREEIALVDGRILDRFSAPVMSGGALLGRVWFFRDITARRRMERGLQQLNGDLEERVAARTRELEQINEQLRRQIADRQRVEQALRHAESKLRFAQKMEAVGLLAGGISHDFNNMLAVVQSCAWLLREMITDDEALAEVEQIEEATGRAAELTRQLLAFSRQQVLRPETLAPGEAVRSVERLLRRLLGTDVTLTVEISASTRAIVADRGQLEQALVNLVVNARDAMPRGGSVTVRTRPVAEIDRARLPELRAREHMAIEVEDEGTGMDPDTQARIFEPFFTTKEVGKGTGLGLAMVYGVVRQSGGQITVDSAVGRGTTITLYLPATAEAEAAREDGSAAPRVETGRRILLVDDEPLVRAAARRILTRAGLIVVDFGAAEEAIAYARQSREPVDLLLSDVQMPAIDGAELARRIRSEDPQLPVLFMSGHAGARASGISPDAGSFLPKPFTPPQLLAAVRAALAPRSD